MAVDEVTWIGQLRSPGDGNKLVEVQVHREEGVIQEKLGPRDIAWKPNLNALQDVFFFSNLNIRFVGSRLKFVGVDPDEFTEMM